ncbi:MAG: GHKL domain-containing protein, partial [Calditrichaeota bacterium]|nr:GHKL domain-containing protein [Calditrichota bacterium]
ARKFAEINDGTFVFAVRDKDAGKNVYLSEETEDDFEKGERLWLLPHLSLQIKLQGITLREIAKRRTLTNLAFLAVVDIVLLLGVLYLLRNISHEMALARLKTDFVANVSHELRTPLALIRMHAETLEMGRVPSDEKKQNYYRTIVAETTRLTQLINNILDFSRIESNKKEYHLTKSDLSELVRQTMAIYLFHLRQKGFHIDVNIDDHLQKIRIDAEAVKQAFMNLLDNAVKFSTDEKQIDVHLHQNDKSIILSVSDRGIGIPQAEQKKIFDKFYRVGTSLVHNTKGSGLGLSLVKHIMDIHNGQVIVKSRVGEGSTFSLVFPVDESKGA